MSLLKQLYKLKSLTREIELISIFSCLLFFPNKGSMLYYLVSAVVVLFFIFKHIIYSHNIGISKFTYWLAAINCLLLVTILFSSYYYRSLLVFWDILIYSIYFILVFIDVKFERRYLKYLGIILSLFSLMVFINYLFPYPGRRLLFFSNPILQGVMSGAGVLIFFHLLQRSFYWPHLVFLLFNVLAVFVSESKAVFLGIILFTLIEVILKKKWLISPILVFVLLSLMIPNPIRKMLTQSLRRDPYVFDRIRIWKMSIKMFQGAFPLGVGLGNFSEAARTYNFKQTKGPANYYKVPRQSHNDFMQLIAETGVVGLFIVIFLVVIMVRKLIPLPRDNLAITLLLYFFFQAMLYNIFFRLPFLFLLLFLMKPLFEHKLTFVSIGKNIKILVLSMLTIILLIGFFIPFLTEVYLSKSSRTRDPLKSFEYLNKAESLAPINYRTHYRKAMFFSRIFAVRSELDAFETSMKYLKKTQRLNRYFVQGYLLEADLFLSLLGKGIKYRGMEGEILNSLNRAEKFHPTNPFIKMRKTRLLFEFGRKNLARKEAFSALALEPDYLEATVFLHKHFDYLKMGRKFQVRKTEIQQKLKRYNPKPGSYLYRLLTIPDES